MEQLKIIIESVYSFLTFEKFMARNIDMKRKWN